ncbi:MAG: YfhO family protein [bacterium]|nr:YfhO family protein [bacterium]
MRYKEIFFLALLILIVLYEPFFLNKAFFYGDMGRYFYPIKHLTLSFIKEGIFLLWNPYLFCGTPLLANPQSQILYPPSILLYIAGPCLGLNLFIFFHLLLAGFSTYLLARQMGLEHPSSFLACLVYTFSGWLISTIDILIAFSSSAWIPIIFYLWLRSVSSLRYTIWTGIAIGLQILAGEPLISYATILLLVIHSIYLIFSERRYYQSRKLILVVLIGIAITLFQLIPFLQLALESTRLSHKVHSTSWSFSPFEMTRFIIPSAFGNPIGATHEVTTLFGGQSWLKSPYLGIIPFLLILLAFKERKPPFFLLSLVIFLLFSFGGYTPIYKFIQSLPFFSLLRYPVKFISIFTLIGAILSGFGFSILIKKRNSSFFFIPFLLVLGLAFFLFLSKDIIISNLKMDDATSSVWVANLLQDTIFISIILFGAGILFFIKEKIKNSIFVLALFLLVLFDLFFFQKRILLTTEPEIFQFETKNIKFLKEKEDRLYISPLIMEKSIAQKGSSHEESFMKNLICLAPNLGLIHKISYCQGYDPIIMRDPSYIIWLINTDHLSRTFHLLSLINARYIISETRIDIEQFKFIFQDGERGPFLYENISFLPRAFFVQKKRVVPNRMKILEEMADPGFNPREEVILEEEPIKNQNAKCKMQNAKSKIHIRSILRSNNPKCKIIKYEPNRVVIDVDTASDGFLFLSDAYYPEWRAYVNGKKTKLYRANYCFRAVQLKEGKHTVEFKYLPRTFIIGLIGSLISLVIMGIGVTIYPSEVKQQPGKKGIHCKIIFEENEQLSIN